MLLVEISELTKNSHSMETPVGNESLNALCNGGEEVLKLITGNPGKQFWDTSEECVSLLILE